MRISNFVPPLLLGINVALTGCASNSGDSPSDVDPAAATAKELAPRASTVDTWCRKNLAAQYYQGAKGVKVGYTSYIPNRAKKAIVLVPGFIEPAAKHCEFIYDLKDSGAAIYVTELRNQGTSDRLLKGNEEGKRG